MLLEVGAWGPQGAHDVSQRLRQCPSELTLAG